MGNCRGNGCPGCPLDYGTLALFALRNDPDIPTTNSTGRGNSRIVSNGEGQRLSKRSGNASPHSKIDVRFPMNRSPSENIGGRSGRTEAAHRLCFFLWYLSPKNRGKPFKEKYTLCIKTINTSPWYLVCYRQKNLVSGCAKLLTRDPLRVYGALDAGSYGHFSECFIDDWLIREILSSKISACRRCGI